MFLKVTTWPPMGGRATVVSRHQTSVRFTVLIETFTGQGTLSREEQQVCVWNNHNGDHEWGGLDLKPTSEAENVMLLNRPSDTGLIRSWFTGELQGLPKHGHVTRFTLKLFVGVNREWQWIHDINELEDGSLVYQTMDFTKHSSFDIGHWFNGTDERIVAKQEKPETPNTCLYSVTTPILASDGKESFSENVILGTPKQLSHFFAAARLWAPWLAPRHGKGRYGVDKDCILASFLRTDGLHVVVLALSGIEDMVTTLFSDYGGNCIIIGRNDRTEKGTARVLVAVADSFEVANAAVMYHARKVIAELSPLKFDKDLQAIVDKGVDAKKGEEWYDGLGYCTWNGLGQNLSSKRLVEALGTLSKSKINITNLIIDDNWQSLSPGDSQFSRGWSEFEAHRDAFPQGLKATTAEIRKKYPNISHIGVWHAIFGYWGGIDPNGWIAKNYKTIEVEKEAGITGGKFTVVAAEDAKRLYDDFYSFLASSGVDSVKADAQFFLDLVFHAPERRALIQEYQDAWTLAHVRHFGGKAISCMSQTPQILFHTQLPQSNPRTLVRNSDDFFPEAAASHPWHIFCNAHNSLFTQHLNIVPDWDMFQTSHEWAGYHAAARCISGGPIYFTDYPGHHDIHLIRQISAQTIHDKTITLRPDTIGKTVDPYSSYESQTLLKIGSHVGNSTDGAGFLGVFNVSDERLSEFVNITDFPGTEDGEFVIGSFNQGYISAPLSRKSAHPLVAIDVDTKRFDILTAFAYKKFGLRGKSVGVANLGLIGKMTGAAAVVSTDMYVEENGRLRINTKLKALGIHGIYVSDLQDRNLDDTLIVSIGGKPISRACVRKSPEDQHIIKIDVHRAWNETVNKSDWNNEVNLEISLS